ncbi:MAG: hypothetical protein IJM92_00650 [Fibrobacter sp.]|uniref:hypothetical protein n=1 Tax=Fibrobacter sp. TaxID=35828 RepID=UPI0025B8862F|nr:hypothetical protein [Fibrobacter sp.]MBQ3715749.1 hypothetical protein [Fibrobacter sp.]MBQ7078183.1 hypothetical protein [Fibrobacter sp.]
MMNALCEKKWLFYLCGISLFLAFVRYKGYDFDAALYLLQVANYLQPERFVNDVPFMFGNQDFFSLFSPIVGSAFKIFGVNTGGMVVTLFSQVALGFSIIALVYRWLKSVDARKWVLPVVLLMFALLANKEYGPPGFYLPIFEPVLVARLFSEVLVIAGLIFFFEKNRYASLVMFVFASLMHPLMGGWALALWLFYHFPKWRIPVLAITLLSPLSGFLHIACLDFYSSVWNPIFFRPDWDDFLLYFGLLLFWLAMFRHFKEGRFARLSINLFWISLAGFYLQFAGSYFEHVFLFQMQPFRVQWLSTILVIPVFAVFVRDCLENGGKMNLCDYAGITLGLCAVAGCQWTLLLFGCLLAIYTPIGRYDKIGLPSRWIKIFFAAGLVFLLVNSILCNFIQLSIEQGVGSTNLAVSWINIPAYLGVVERILLISFALMCTLQKKYGLALIFAVAFCCNGLKILPLVGLILILIPNLNYTMKNFLLASSFSISFFEILSSLHKLNSLEQLPLENAPVACVVLFVVLTIVSFWLMSIRKDPHGRKALVPLVVLLVSLSAWDVYRWDSRDEIVALNEKQMDAFFEAPIFPQVKDRGKLLFTVDYEAPIQSRINFMTGAYADESIYVGEVFYKEQFMESNRRRSALLTGSPQMVNLAKFKEEIIKVYGNPDTLLTRVRYLCGAGEVTHFATDYANMPLPKQDSVYLNVKQKFVWLYGCPGD